MQVKRGGEKTGRDWDSIEGSPSLIVFSLLAEPLSLSRRHSQRRTSELSDVSSARACFAGLYSLTTIQNSPSFDLSDCQQPSSLESFTPATPPESLNFVSIFPSNIVDIPWGLKNNKGFCLIDTAVSDKRTAGKYGKPGMGWRWHQRVPRVGGGNNWRTAYYGGMKNLS